MRWAVAALTLVLAGCSTLDAVEGPAPEGYHRIAAGTDLELVGATEGFVLWKQGTAFRITELPSRQTRATDFGGLDVVETHVAGGRVLLVGPQGPTLHVWDLRDGKAQEVDIPDRYGVAPRSPFTSRRHFPVPGRRVAPLTPSRPARRTSLGSTLTATRPAGAG